MADARHRPAEREDKGPDEIEYKDQRFQTVPPIGDCF